MCVHACVYTHTRLGARTHTRINTIGQTQRHRHVQSSKHTHSDAHTYILAFGSVDRFPQYIRLLFTLYLSLPPLPSCILIFFSTCLTSTKFDKMLLLSQIQVVRETPARHLRQQPMLHHRRCIDIYRKQCVCVCVHVHVCV